MPTHQKYILILYQKHITDKRKISLPEISYLAILKLKEESG